MDRIALDAKDRRLLYELDRNARQPLSSLAKKVRLSQPAAAYRLARLVRRGVIRKFITIINVNKLGYLSHRVYIRYRKVDPKKEAEMIAYLSSHPRVFWFASLSGRWDLEILIFARDFYEFTKIFDGIRSRWEENIGSHVLSMATYNYHFKRRHFLDSGEDEESPVPLYGGEPRASPEVDATDLKILKLLATDARATLAEIARKSGLSGNTAKYRIRKMERLKIIQTYRVWVDYSKIGYELYKMTASIQNLTEQKERALLEFCRGVPNAVYLIRCAGPWDIEMEFEVEGNERYREIMLDFRKNFGDSVMDYETVLVYKEHKINYFPMG